MPSTWFCSFYFFPVYLYFVAFFVICCFYICIYIYIYPLDFFLGGGLVLIMMLTLGVHDRPKTKIGAPTLVIHKCQWLGTFNVQMM